MSGIDSAEHARISAPATWRWFQILAGATGDAIPLLFWGYIAFCLLYGLTIIYGFVDGYALPTTAIFSALPHGDWIARGEKYLPAGLLFVAMLGASLGWINAAGLAVPRWQQNQQTLIRLFLWFGLPVICLTFILALSDAGWNGRIVMGQGEYFSLAGLVPHSDAAGHFLGPFVQALTGSWSDFASRRPFAAGMRQLIVAMAGFSYAWTLLIQTIVLSAALFAATRSVILWRGFWTGLAFVALFYLLARPYHATTATEQLGLGWALLSIMFLADAMRLGALRCAFLALATLTFGELIRMGSILTIPALCLWIARAFGTRLRERITLFAAGCLIAALAVFVQSLCAWLYGNPTTIIGGNFAYTLCGLATGGDWTTCPKLFAQEFSRLTTEHDHITFLYSKAIGNIFQDPSVVFRDMYFNIRDFVRGMPDFMLAGWANPNRSIPPEVLFLLSPGLIFTMRRNRARGEVLFWILMFASMTASAAIIFRDDGWRTFSVTWPLVALFIALGCTFPRALPLHDLGATLSFRGGVLLISAIVGLVLLTPAVTRIWPGRELQKLSKLVDPHDDLHAILFGPMMSGFLVIPDNSPLPKQVPAVHLTDFVNLVQDVGIERDYGQFLFVALKEVPFAFVTAGLINYPETEELYLAPPEMLKNDRAANAWRLTLGNRLHNVHIHDVVAVEKLP